MLQSHHRLCFFRRHRSLLRFSSVVGTNLLSGVATLAAAALVARALGQEGKGIVTLVVLVGTLGGVVTDCGMSSAVVFFRRRREIDWGILTGNALAWTLTIGVAAAAVVYAFLLAWQPFGIREDHVAALIAALLIIPSLAILVFRQALLADGLVRGFNVSTLIETTSIPLVLGTLFVFGRGIGLEVVLSTYLGAWVMSAASAVLSLRWIERPSFELRALRMSLRYGAPAQLGTILQYLNYRLDVVLTAGLAGVASLGVYSVAYAVAEVLWRVPRLVALLLFPKVSGLVRERAAEYTASIFRLSLVFSLVLAALLAASGFYAIPLVFGRNFAEAVIPFLILIPGVFFANWYLLLVEHLKARGQPEAKLKVAAVGTLVTLVLGIVLIPAFGARGAAAASSAAYLASGLLALWLFRSESGVSIRRLFSFRRDELGIVMDGRV